MEIVKQTVSAQYEVSATLEFADIGGGVGVFRLTENRCPIGVPHAMVASHILTEVREGFATLQDLQAHKSGVTTRLSSRKEFVLCPPEFLTMVARYGFSTGAERAEKAAPKGFDARQPFTQIVERQVPVDLVLRIEHSSHMVFSRKGEVLPVAVHFDYISAGMHDGKYDLVRALEILKDNPRVRFLDRYEREAEGKVLSIPSYNSEEFKTESLDFWFEPTQEEQRLMWEKQQGYGARASLEDYRAIFDLDLLGLRAGGAAYYQDFDASRETDYVYQDSVAHADEDDES
jgi:hypothetical protein